MNICYIIGAGDVFSANIKADESDFVICADGGYKYKGILKKEPDIILGDFDSLGHIPQSDNCEVFPCEKDESDMLLALDEGLKKGYKTFVVFGGLGGERMDHSVANLQLLHYAALKGTRTFLVHDKTIFTAVCNGEIHFKKHCRGYVSVFSLTDISHGVTIKNLKYEVENDEFRNYAIRGLSNEFIGDESYIKVKKGVLLISWKGNFNDSFYK